MKYNKNIMSFGFIMWMVSGVILDFYLEIIMPLYMLFAWLIIGILLSIAGGFWYCKIEKPNN
jgi:hypothetical protein